MKELPFSGDEATHLSASLCVAVTLTQTYAAVGSEAVDTNRIGRYARRTYWTSRSGNDMKKPSDAFHHQHF